MPEMLAYHEKTFYYLRKPVWLENVTYADAARRPGTKFSSEAAPRAKAGWALNRPA
jgi:hypothetical protein